LRQRMPKAPKVQPPPPWPSGVDKALSLKELKAEVLRLREDNAAAGRERTEAATDRDALQRFYDVGALELREVELSILAKQRAKEAAADNHATEVRVYQQKIKHLMFEHQGVASSLETAAAAEVEEEEQAHLVREALLRLGKGDLRDKIRAMEDANAEAIRSMKLNQDKSLQTMKQDFGALLDKLRAKYDGRLASLRADLQLRRKVLVHEVEERKNLHIHQLTRAHEEAFGEMRRYYNDITRSNLELISQLKARIAEANGKAAHSQRLVLEIAEENKKLSEPLQRALSERAQLEAELKDRARDRAGLAYARKRLGELRGSLAVTQSSQADLEARYAAAAAEKEDLYAKFEATVRALAEKAESRGAALERHLAEAENEHTAAHAAAAHVVAAAQLDPLVLSEANARVEGALTDRNAAIRGLQVAVARLRKAHDEAVRILSAKLVELGVEKEEANTVVPLLNPGGFTGPSGLISQPL
jgi:hypothetical protein